MTRKEYRETLAFELYKGKSPSLFRRFRVKHLQPNTNCMYLARKMWYLYEAGGLRRKLSKLYYLRIVHRFGCCIYANISVGKGFYIAHPVGIVIGKCSIGDNFTVYQNASIGVRHPGDEQLGRIPKIGNDVRLCTGSAILGDISVADHVTIGANSLVIKTIGQAGTYAGSPVRRIGNT